MSANTQRMYAGTYKLALELIDVQVELGQIDKFAELLGELSCKNVKMSANRQHMYAGTYNLPWNRLNCSWSCFRLMRLPSSFGNSPAKNGNVSKHTTHVLVCWGIRLTLKLVVARIEVRQIDKVAKLLGQFSCKK